MKLLAGQAQIKPVNLEASVVTLACSLLQETAAPYFLGYTHLEGIGIWPY